MPPESASPDRNSAAPQGRRSLSGDGTCRDPQKSGLPWTNQPGPLAGGHPSSRKSLERPAPRPLREPAGPPGPAVSIGGYRRTPITTSGGSRAFMLARTIALPSALTPPVNGVPPVGLTVNAPLAVTE